MANINDNIRTKKLYKSGNTTIAYKDSNGEIVVPSSVASEIAAVSDITELLNDHDNYSKSIYLLKEIENIRLDLEELHSFIKNAFGKDSSQAASKGDKGDSGSTGPQGPAGSNGKDGSVGATGPQGPQGATGATGSKGPAGANGAAGAAGAAGADGNNGSNGKNGADGNSHLSNVTSIAFSPKANKLQVNIGGTVYNFVPSK